MGNVAQIDEVMRNDGEQAQQQLCDNTLPCLPASASALERRRSTYNGFAEAEDA